MTRNSSFFLAAAITGSLQWICLPAKADQSYSANCEAVGDAIALTSTGEIVLEQRLIAFKPTGNTNRGQKGICVIKQDPPGHRWIQCWKKDGMFATGHWEHPTIINPVEAVANSVQYRGWSGACKVKL